MGEDVRSVMFEHLKNLKESAEECEDNMLGIITAAMVQTAEFLTKLPSEGDS